MFFEDIVNAAVEVTEWQEGECSVECAGGIRQLTRTVVTMPSGGSECPPLVTDVVGFAAI